MEEIIAAKGKSWEQIQRERPTEIYINVNKLFTAIMNDKRLSMIVQNPIVFYVGAIIMTGTDYFNGSTSGSFLPGIGVERIIWPTLFENAYEFKHMIQSSIETPSDYKTWCDIVIDEDAFFEFCNLCYLKATDSSSIEEVRSSFEKREEKRVQKIRATITKLESKGQDASKERAKLGVTRDANTILSRVDLRIFARHLWQNLLYWRNAYKKGYEREPNIFATNEEGESLYGFVVTVTGSGAVAPYVALKSPISIDEVFKRHFFAERRKDLYDRRNDPASKVTQDISIGVVDE